MKNKENQNEQATYITEDEEIVWDGMNKWHIWAFGVGHLLNDLSATMLMTYVLIYLSNINPIHPTRANEYTGIVFLIGQTIDGLATPTVGVICDSFETRFGRKKPWYVLGTFLTIISFIMVYEGCVFCRWAGDEWSLRPFYYAFFFGVYNIGFAMVQIPHLSLMPTVTCSRKRRDTLSSLRNTFTYTANLIVPVIAMVIFSTVDEPIYQFKILSYITSFMGLITSTWFIIQIDEPMLAREAKRRSKEIQSQLEASARNETEVNRSSLPLDIIDVPEKTQKNNIDNEEGKDLTKPLVDKKEKSNAKSFDVSLKSSPKESKAERKKREDVEFEKDKQGNLVAKHVNPDDSLTASKDEHFPWYRWFGVWLFYQYCLAYLGTRIIYITIGSMINYYLVFVCRFSEKAQLTETPIQLAIIPMILFFSSIVASSVNENLYSKYGRKKTYVMGCATLIVAGIIMLCLNQDRSSGMYFACIVLGFGQAISLNTGTAVIADVVGLRGHSGAFVYGFYGLVERVINGIIMYFILGSDYMIEGNQSKGDFIRITSSVIPVLACIFSGFTILIGGARDRDQSKGIGNEFAAKITTPMYNRKKFFRDWLLYIFRFFSFLAVFALAYIFRDFKLGFQKQNDAQKLALLSEISFFACILVMFSSLLFEIFENSYSMIFSVHVGLFSCVFAYTQTEALKNFFYLILSQGHYDDEEFYALKGVKYEMSLLQNLQQIVLLLYVYLTLSLFISISNFLRWIHKYKKKRSRAEYTITEY